MQRVEMPEITAQPVGTFNPYLDQFDQLTNPVPNFAATLTTQAEQDAEDDNISFLRGALPDDDESSYEESRESRRRMRRAVDAMVGGRRYTPAQLRQLGELEESVHEDRNRRSLQDYQGWAPGTSDEEDDPHTGPQQGSQNSAPLLDEQVLRRDEHLRDRMRLRRLRDSLAARSEDAQPIAHQRERSSHEQSRPVENRGTLAPAGAASTSESSLRTTALLHAVRQNTQFSTHSRDQLQRYLLHRGRIGRDNEERERANPTRQAVLPSLPDVMRDRERLSRHASTLQQIEQQHQQERNNHEAAVRQEIQQHRDLLAEHQEHRDYLEEQLRQQRHGLVGPTDSRRRRYWGIPSPCRPSEKRSVDNTLKYLERLRLCESDQEGRQIAEEVGFGPEEFCPKDPSNFLIDTTLISPPPESSWLRSGNVLNGTQHAASSKHPPTYTPLMPPSQYRSRIQHPTLGAVSARTTSPVRSSSQIASIDRATDRVISTEDERWPVKVTIHSVNYDEMTLSGSMEAFDVPDISAPTRRSNITTFLEGEIIDFNTFTLETKSFKSDTRTDGTYWRKLPPFKDLKDDDVMVKNLLSHDWLRTELMGKWILMRWKEKSFITPSQTRSSLTISGFYYISLRRSDGYVEGLYHDPSCTPYQHLSLVPEMPTFPSFTFA